MFLAACVVIPFLIWQTLKYPTSFFDLATIASLATGLGTFAGALGTGLASEEFIRQGAYSEWECQRRQLWESNRKGTGRGYLVSWARPGGR
ncbi:hypothetical protein ACFW4X_14640 [Streptomyces smyrnaeus]|uniref:hypothetical protein n=1 Tax=Streptomyces smyrnaeus TaxID=1387713 RepID=UPI00367D81D6